MFQIKFQIYRALRIPEMAILMDDTYCALLFLAHFYPHNPPKRNSDSGMTQILCQHFLDTFSQEKNGEIKMKSQERVKKAQPRLIFFTLLR